MGLNGRSRVEDAWLWGDSDPPYEKLLSGAAGELSGGDARRLEALERVSNRLLDRVRIRKASAGEDADARLLLDGCGLSADAVAADSHSLRPLLKQVAVKLAAGDAEREVRLLSVAELVIRRAEIVAAWDSRVEDGVPDEIQPLHMPAVKEALGSLIPEHLHSSLDKRVERQKDVTGVVSSGCFVTMGSWRVNVRSEDELFRGRLTKEVLELFMKVLQRISDCLHLNVAVGSKTVGVALGQSESVDRMSKVLLSWSEVWNKDKVGGREEVLIPVAVDDREQNWVTVAVRSVVDGEILRSARRLRVCCFDPHRRSELLEQISRNVDVLIRGVGAQRAVGDAGPVTEFADFVPEESASTQRSMMRSLGIIMGAIGRRAGEKVLDMRSEYYISEVGRVVWSVFAKLRQLSGEKGSSDFACVLADEAACRTILQMLGSMPSLTTRGADGAGGGVEQEKRSLDVGACVGGVACGAAPTLLQSPSHLRAATWNIAGGLIAASAPERYAIADKRLEVVSEILRWRREVACDVVALQECEGADCIEEIVGAYDFVGSASASQSRGYVHLYVRKGMSCERIAVRDSLPCVAATVTVEGGAGASIHVAAVHLPAGIREVDRARIVQDVRRVMPSEEHCLIVGDFNARDEEIDALCSSTRMRSARYNGCSWGTRGNKFYSDSEYRGRGLKYDRALFGRSMWAEAHLAAQRKVQSEGLEFCMSDHFGLMVYAEVNDVFRSRAAVDEKAVVARKRDLALIADKNRVREMQYLQFQAQAMQKQRAVERQRAVHRDRESVLRAQRQGARVRHQRRARLQQEAYGAGNLYAQEVVVESDDGSQDSRLSRLEAASRIVLPHVSDVGRGSWAIGSQVPVVGFRNLGWTCYASSAVQVLLRVPAVVDWLRWHGSRPCGLRDIGLQDECVACLLHRTLVNMCEGSAAGCVHLPVAHWRASVHEKYREEGRQCDASEFLLDMLVRLREQERSAHRCSWWNHGLVDGSADCTHVDRLFGAVAERRSRCTVCHMVRAKYTHQTSVELDAAPDDGIPMTVSELFLKEFAPERQDGEPFRCPRCECNRVHVQQRRIVHAPNVLVVQIKRLHVDPAQALDGVLARHRVSVEEALSLRGLPRMVLAGVVYHSGRTAEVGHYVSAVRGLGGRYWMCDDRNVRIVQQDISVVKPSEVNTLVYVREDGQASFVGGGIEGYGPGVGGGVIHVDGDGDDMNGEGAVPCENDNGIGDANGVRAGAGEVGGSAVGRDVGKRKNGDATDGDAGHGVAGAKADLVGNSALTPSRRLRRKSSLGAVGDMSSSATRARVLRKSLSQENEMPTEMQPQSVNDSSMIPVVEQADLSASRVHDELQSSVEPRGIDEEVAGQIRGGSGRGRGRGRPGRGGVDVSRGTGRGRPRGGARVEVSEGVRRSGRIAAQRGECTGAPVASATVVSHEEGASVQRRGASATIRGGVLQRSAPVSSEEVSATRRVAPGRVVGGDTRGPIVTLTSTDVRADEERRDREQVDRAVRRNRTGERGDMRAYDGSTLSRSAGGPVNLGRR